MRERKTFDVKIQHNHIRRGRPTTASNPFSIAIRESTLWKAARVDNQGGWLELWDGRRWHLTLLPGPARRWLDRWLRGQEVHPRSFRVHA